MCPPDEFMIKGHALSEDFRGYGRAPGNDDSGINGLNFTCVTIEGTDAHELNADGPYGTWKEKDWSVH